MTASRVGRRIALGAVIFAVAVALMQAGSNTALLEIPVLILALGPVLIAAVIVGWCLEVSAALRRIESRLDTLETPQLQVTNGS